MELSVIVPVYNEGKHLMSMAEKLSPYLDTEVKKSDWQFVLVNNGSKDDSEQVIKQIIKIWPKSLYVKLKYPDYGNALRHGLKAAQGKWAFIINVDFWDPIFFSWAWHNRNKYDLFIGSKRADPSLDHRPKYRKLLSWGLNLILQGYFGLVATDTHGQKLLNLEKLRPIIDLCIMNRGQFDTELTIRAQRAGLKIAEFPVPIHEKRKQRNLMLKKILQNFIDIFKLKRILKNVPSSGTVYYHRYSRKDYKLNNIREKNEKKCNQ